MRSYRWVPRLQTIMLGGLLSACAPKGQPPAQREDSPAPGPLEPLAADLGARALPDPNHDSAAEAPLSLTASDGTGLRLVSLTGRAVVQEPLAFTELHLVFDNPEPRTIEGRFQIDLPPDAAISRFAMKIGARWQEGEVVERQAARRAYEDFLHRKQDPALLEKQAGNRFTARVFPIPANARKELIISYSQELTDSREPYRMILEGLPELDTLDVEIVIDRPAGAGSKTGATSIGGSSSSREEIVVLEHNFVPDKNLEVASARPAETVGIRHQELALARVAAVGELPPDPVDELTILFDTSASRALGFDGQLRRLEALVAELRAGADFRLRVMTFDQELALIYEGSATGFGPAQLQKIYSGRAMGASDLTHALTRLAEVGGSRRVVLVSDGIATAGETELFALEAAVTGLGEAGVERLDAIIDGGLQDRDTLVAMTSAGLARDGVVLDARASADTLATRLKLATLSDIEVSVPGAEWSWPVKLDGVQPGDEVLVYAKLPEDMPMRVLLGGEQTTEAPVELTEVSEALLERAWVGARIDAKTLQRSELGTEPGERALRDELRAEIVRLSTTHRVLSDFTALLVLETEADYARFNIDRKALADILTVGEQGVVATARTSLWFGRGPVLEQPEARPKADEQAGGQGQRHEGEEGQMGKPTSRSRSGLHAMQGPRSVVPQMAREFDGAKDSEEVWGGLTGSEIGEAYGTGGLGLIGTGRGGGGTSEDTSELGDTRLIGTGGGGGTGTGTGTGTGYGRGSGAGFGGRGTGVPTVRQARPTIRGSLDKDIVRRIVRAHINEVRSCYNAGLSKDPSLGGMLAIKFVVTSRGEVASSIVQESTIESATVSKCVAKAVKRWKFPKPPDAGNVVVTYPFLLSPGDGDPPPPPPPV
ncbi:AgmX/PglI C-terminal domain-containing protein, partial [Enhygromyxa salina]|uniref:AgmX/PglI C-terminal domain-containing protein n=1 Tax=Enhygromyxa salina TaxID=215803 RepID=UPI0011B28B56